MDERKKKAKSYFVLMILSLIVFVGAFAAMYIGAIVLNNGDMILMCVGVGVIAMIVSAITGGLAHRNVDKDGEKWERVAYVLTYPSYVASYLLFCIVGALFSGAKQAWDKAGSSASDNSDNNNIIIKDYYGKEIELRFIERSTYYNYKGRSDHPYYGKSYFWYQEARFQGDFWMSFDEGKTFVREDDFNPYTYNK